MPGYRPLIERFNEKYEILPNGCWYWTAYKNKKRGEEYGFISDRKSKNKNKNKNKGHMRKAHRVSYELHYGVKLTKEDIICHKCDNPSCVNPQHLYAGSTLSNSIDRMTRTGHHNSDKTHCNRGHEFNLKNTRFTSHIRKDGKQVKHRHCKICERIVRKERRNGSE